MADGLIQVPTDSTGKKVDTTELTVGSNTVERQRIHLAGAAAAELADVRAAPPAATLYGLVVRVLRAIATATLSNAAASSSNQTALASNAARQGALFTNDSDGSCLLKYGVMASSTSYTKKLLSGETWSMPDPIYTGIIDVIWESNLAAGALRVTELTA